MKISSISNNGMASMYASHQAHEPLFENNALHRFFEKLSQIGSAIALAEAGDLDGAKALRNEHAK
jgi:hypothetical protein